MFLFLFLLFSVTQTLTTLILGDNGIGIAGAKFLANALSVNTVRRIFLYLFKSSYTFFFHVDTHNSQFGR